MTNIKIFSYPALNISNPYLIVFYNCLRQHGYVWSGEINFQESWLSKNKEKNVILHFHWPEGIWYSRWGFFVSICKLVRLWHFLEVAKKQGKILISTLHNLYRHENAGWLDRFGLTMICRICDLTISHSQWAADKAVELFNCEPEKVVVMYHGNFQNRYPMPRPRTDICAAYGLDERLPIIGCLGTIRPYKGLDSAIKAVKKIERVQLLIAGRAGRLFYLFKRYFFENAKKKLGKRMIFINKTLTDQEFSDLMGVCDVVLLSYKEVTGSGLLLAALTFGKPVVVSNLPYFKEILRPEPKAFLAADPFEPDSMALAIQQMLSSDLSEARSAAYRLAERYQWDNVIRPLVFKLNELLEKNQKELNENVRS